MIFYHLLNHHYIHKSDIVEMVVINQLRGHHLAVFPVVFQVTVSGSDVWFINPINTTAKINNRYTYHKPKLLDL